LRNAEYDVENFEAKKQAAELGSLFLTNFNVTFLAEKRIRFDLFIVRITMIENVLNDFWIMNVYIFINSQDFSYIGITYIVSFTFSYISIQACYVCS